MKRSEVIDKIEGFVHQNRRATQAWTSEDMAEEIMTIIEEAGMLPPYNNGSERLEGHIIYCNWEPED